MEESKDKLERMRGRMNARRNMFIRLVRELLTHGSFPHHPAPCLIRLEHKQMSVYFRSNHIRQSDSISIYSHHSSY